MSYQLAVDLGTTHLSAAVARPDGTVGPAAALGAGTGTVPAVVHVDADGRLAVGEAAARRLLSDPDRVVRELVRRIGDRTPLVVGGAPVAAEALAARVVAHVARAVAATEGGPAGRIAVTHPTSWGPHRVEALRAALAATGLDRPLLLTEAQAAAERHAAAEPVETGAVLAVLDIGGGSCDAAVVRRDPHGFTLLGRPERIERLGGSDVDDVVFEHVRAELGARWDALDPADPATLAAVAALRRDCAAAKEALSGSGEVAVPVALPGIRVDVELTRAALVELIRPAVGEAADLLARVVEPVTASVVEPGSTTVLLVGGSTRIPLVAELVAQRTGLPVVRVDDPVAAVAAGAALVAGRAGRRAPVAGPVVPAGPAVTAPAALTVRTAAIGPVGPGSRPDLDRLDARAPHPGTRPDLAATTRGAVPVAAAASGVAGPPPGPIGPGDPPGGVHPFRPERPERRRIPLVASVLAAVVAAAVLVGGLISIYRSPTIAPTGSPAVASTPDPTAPALVTTPATEPEEPAQPELPRREPDRPAPPARTGDRAAPTTTTAPAAPTTTAAATQPPATTAPPAEQADGAGDGADEGADDGAGDGAGGPADDGAVNGAEADDGNGAPAPAGSGAPNGDGR